MSLLQSYHGWQKLDRGRRSVKLNGHSANILRLPVLGAAGSGKQRVAEIMRTVFGKDVENIEDDEISMDVMPYKGVMRAIAVKTMISMVRELDSSGAQYSYPETSADVSTALSYEPEGRNYPNIPREVWRALKRIWADPSVVIAAEQNTKWELFVETERYFNDIDRLAASLYVPSSNDVIACRKKLNCISETPLRDNVWLLEVAPIRNKSSMKSILQFFEKESVIIYCVDVSLYDQFENDGKTSKLLSGYEDFKRIASSKFTKNVSIIVFFTMNDAFERKLSKRSLKVCFSKYSEGNTYKEASTYIANLFRSVQTKTQQVFTIFVSCSEANFSKDKLIVKQSINTCFLYADVYRLRLL